MFRELCKVIIIRQSDTVWDYNDRCDDKERLFSVLRHIESPLVLWTVRTEGGVTTVYPVLTRFSLQGFYTRVLLVVVIIDP